MAYQGENFVARYGKQAAQTLPQSAKCWTWVSRSALVRMVHGVASYNPWIALYWLITRKTLGGKDFTANENKLDRITALKLYTQGSASLINQDKDRGAIKKRVSG